MISASMSELTLTQPDDWHVHLRDDDWLFYTVPAVSKSFHRYIVMPNLSPPIIDCQQALDYRQRLLKARPNGSDGHDSEPLMVLFLTEETSISTIEEVAANPSIQGLKLYPKGVTTGSSYGIADIIKCYPIFAAMERLDVPLLIHGESPDEAVDIFDREAVFIDKCLRPLVDSFPGLRLVFEHITSSEAVDFVFANGSKIAATITPQHLLFNRNHLLAGGIRPHYYCAPILKRDSHQRALIAAATSGDPSFFLGSDSAPHDRLRKESECGCAGCFSGQYTLELYALAFERAQALDKLEQFASYSGADFYGLPRNSRRLRLLRADQEIPAEEAFNGHTVIPLMAGQTVPWRVEHAHS